MFFSRRIVRAAVAASTIVIALFSVSCSESSSVDERLVTAYAESIIARETSIDSVTSNRRFDSVVAKHGYNRTSFQEALRQQSLEPNRFRTFYDSVSSRLRQRGDTTAR